MTAKYKTFRKSLRIITFTTYIGVKVLIRFVVCMCVFYIDSLNIHIYRSKQ